MGCGVVPPWDAHMGLSHSDACHHCAYPWPPVDCGDVARTHAAFPGTNEFVALRSAKFSLYTWDAFREREDRDTERREEDSPRSLFDETNSEEYQKLPPFSFNPRHPPGKESPQQPLPKPPFPTPQLDVLQLSPNDSSPAKDAVSTPVALNLSVVNPDATPEILTPDFPDSFGSAGGQSRNKMAVSMPDSLTIK